MTLHAWELKDPQALISVLAERVDLAEDTAWLATVFRPSTEQRLVDVRRLGLPALLDDDDDISEDLRLAAESFGIPDTGEIQHAFLTVLVRPGRCVVGPNEAVWLNGWRYSNHFQRAFSGDLIVVTEYGWVAFMSEAAGHQPRMRSARVA